MDNCEIKRSDVSGSETDRKMDRKTDRNTETAAGYTPGDNTSGGNIPGNNTSGDNTSGDNTSGENTLGDNTSGDNTSGDNTLEENFAVDNFPEDVVEEIIPGETAVRRAYREITLELIKRNISISTCESCTSGQIASLLTDTEGASAVFSGAYVTYSNVVKELLGVSEAVINRYGVYSVETAEAMAGVCRERFEADLGVGVTGTFGNIDPYNEDSVLGVIYFSIAGADGFHTYRKELPICPSRYAYKLAAAGLIAEELKKELGIT